MTSTKAGLLALAVVLVTYAPSARGQVVGFAPTIGTAPDGVIMPVTPVATDDRRYVRMTLNPQFYGLQGFDTVQVPAAVGGGGAGGFGGRFGNGSGGGFGNHFGGAAGFGGAAFGPGMGTYNGAPTGPDFTPLMGTIRSQVGRRRRGF